MKVTLTGTGTSQGVPVIGCKCDVCTSDDSKDQRLRTAAVISKGKTQIAIDAGPDFRQQMLSSQIDHLDSLFITHEHNDHVAGLDDIRPFNFMQRSALSVFAFKNVLNKIRSRFDYVFAENVYPGAPSIDLIECEPFLEVRIGDLTLLPLVLRHGQLDVLGLKCGSFVYITDANEIPQETGEQIRGADVMVINALHHREHHSHFSLKEAIDQADKWHIGRIYITHISHRMGLYREIQPTMPSHINLAYDGLELFF